MSLRKEVNRYIYSLIVEPLFCIQHWDIMIVDLSPLLIELTVYTQIEKEVFAM